MVQFESAPDDCVKAAVEYLDGKYDGGEFRIEEKGTILEIIWPVAESDDPDEFDPTVLEKGRMTVRTVETSVRKEEVMEEAEERGLIDSD